MIRFTANESLVLQAITLYSAMAMYTLMGIDLTKVLILMKISKQTAPTPLPFRTIAFLFLAITGKIHMIQDFLIPLISQKMLSSQKQSLISAASSRSVFYCIGRNFLCNKNQSIQTISHLNALYILYLFCKSSTALFVFLSRAAWTRIVWINLCCCTFLRFSRS